MKKLAVLFVTIGFCFSLLIGCQAAPATTTSQSQTTAITTASQSQATSEAPSGVPFAETFEFSILSTKWSPYDAEKTLIDAIMELTNTKINMEWSPRDNYDTKVNTVIASNNIPDVILGASVVPLVNQGAIIPLDEYYEQYAPNIMAALNPEDYPFIRNVNDGHIYSLLYVFDFKPAQSWMIRRDWLERLDLDVPTTWNDWLEVWRAMRDEDANGDGDPANEIPYTGEATLFFETFGMVASGDRNFAVMPDGGYSLVYEHPNYKTYLETMSMMYQEKLLDQEFATRVMAERYKVMDSNLGGSTLVWAEQAKLSTVVLRENDPNATCVCIPPPQGPLGDQFIPARGKVSSRGVVTINAERSNKVENIVRFFDWLYSDDGVLLMNFGIEGTHHIVVDGKPKLNEPYINSFVEARANGLIFQPFPFYWVQENYMQILLMGKQYDELDEPTQIFYDGLFMNEPYFCVSPPTLVTNAYSEKSADFIPTLKELQANAIAGRITVDQFFSEYEKLKGQGLQAIIDEADEAWQIVSAD